MDLNVYTSTLETRIEQMLSQMYSITKYNAEIDCYLRVDPQYSTNVHFRVENLMPREGIANLTWAKDLYNRLRLFSCQENSLTVKFVDAKSRWTPERYNEGDYYDYGQARRPKLWTNLAENKGLSAIIEAMYPKPEESSNAITVRLDWKYQAPGGEVSCITIRAPQIAIPMLLPLHPAAQQ
jgi:hypothetical protein